MGSAFVSHSQSDPSQALAGSPVAAQYGNATSTTATGSSGSTAILVGTAGRTIYLTDLSGFTTSVGANLNVFDGSTLIWQQTISTTTYAIDLVTPLRSSAGNNLTVTLAGSSTVNVSGYYNP